MGPGAAFYAVPVSNENYAFHSTRRTRDMGSAAISAKYISPAERVCKDVYPGAYAVQESTA
jgi:hypothetical protein